VERFPHRLHPLAHGQVAHAHFAQVHVHVGEHGIEHGLSQCVPRGVPRGWRRGEAADEQEDMQADEIEPAVERVGHAEVDVKARLARRRHGGSIKLVAGALVPRALQEAEQAHESPVSSPGRVRGDRGIRRTT